MVKIMLLITDEADQRKKKNQALECMFITFFYIPGHSCYWWALFIHSNNEFLIIWKSGIQLKNLKDDSLLKIDFRHFEKIVLKCSFIWTQLILLFCSWSDKCFNRFCGQKTPINFDRLLFEATLFLLSEGSFSIQGLISISTKLALRNPAFKVTKTF